MVSVFLGFNPGELSFSSQVVENITVRPHSNSHSIYGRESPTTWDFYFTFWLISIDMRLGVIHHILKLDYPFRTMTKHEEVVLLLTTFFGY